MRAYDNPIEHFQLIERVARYLESIEVQLLSSEYSYQTFGSWWLTFQKKGENYRMVYDGRDFELRLENDPIPTKVHGVFISEWTELVALSAADLKGVALQSAIEELIQRGLAKLGIT